MPPTNDTGTTDTNNSGSSEPRRSSGTSGTNGTGATSATDRRRRLRREAPSIFGLLADPGDFAAMRRYDSFAFEDHGEYLRQVDGLLRSLTAQGIHTAVALFDADEYADYCAEEGLDPDTAETRTRFTAELAGAGPLLPYAGQPIEELAPLLVDAAVRLATWEYATTLLAGIGRCADCGEDIGHASFERAADALKRLLAGAGPGHHHLVCSVPTEGQQLLAVLHATVPAAEAADEPGGPPRTDGRDGLDFVTVLAAGLALGGPGGLVLRSTTDGDRDRVHGWRLDRGRLTALSAAAVFNAYCTDADTGEPVAPEPGVEYCPGYEVDEPGPHH
ncbi:hypothetical protein [Streptomyces sp. NPDC002990]